MRILIVCAGLAIAVFTYCATPVSAAPVSFKSKTIRVIVPYAPGGAVDVVARLIANHIRKYLPGEPTIIVNNMPGAAGVLGANYLYSVAPKDGTAFAVTIPPFTTEFIGHQAVHFVSAKFNWIGSFNISQVTFVHKGFGIHSASDLLKTHRQLIIGGMRPNAARDLRMRAFLDALGIKNYKYVTGYRGTAPVRLAFRRGEVNFSDEAVAALVTSLRPDLNNGTVIPLVQTGLTQNGKRVRDPRMPDVPLAENTVVKLRGASAKKSVAYRGMRDIIEMVALGRAIILPPGVDPEIVRTWRKAIAKLNTDKGFQHDAAKQTGGEKMILTSGAESQAQAEQIAKIMTQDPAAADYLNKLAKGH